MVVSEGIRSLGTTGEVDVNRFGMVARWLHATVGFGCRVDVEKTVMAGNFNHPLLGGIVSS